MDNDLEPMQLTDGQPAQRGLWDRLYVQGMLCPATTRLTVRDNHHLLSPHQLRLYSQDAASISLLVCTKIYMTPWLKNPARRSRVPRRRRLT